MTYTFPITEKSLDELKHIVTYAQPGDAMAYKQDGWWLMRTETVAETQVNVEYHADPNTILSRIVAGCPQCGQPYSMKDMEMDMPARGGCCSACR